MTPSRDEHLASARALAQSAEWRKLAAFVRTVSIDLKVLGPELVVLYAEALTRTGQEREASDWLTRAQPFLIAERDAAILRRALNLLALTQFTLGRLEETNTTFASVLEMAHRAEDFLLVARASNNLGAIANLQGNREVALGYYRLAIPMYQRLGNQRGIAESHHNMAITFRELSQLEESDEEEYKAMEYAASGNAPRISTMARIGRAEVALRHSDLQLAQTGATIAVEEARALDDPFTEADGHRLLGVVVGVQGKYEEALQAFDRALSIATARSHALAEAETLRDRAILNTRRGFVDLARKDAQKAIDIFARMNAVSEIANLERELAGL
jgi:tetratricopeptide (TPR) repeat protein